MKLIFLDIDGVLNKFTTKERFEGCLFIENRKVRYLKELVEATRAKIILTSPWRRGWYCMDHGLDQKPSDREDIRFYQALISKLREYELELLGYTDDFGPRGKEIERWLSEWNGEPVESIVILDALEKDELKPYSDYVVQTSLCEGLTPKHTRKAIKLLNDSRSKL